MDSKNEFNKYMKGFGVSLDEEIAKAKESGDLNAELFARFQKFNRTVRAGQRNEFGRRGCGRGPVPADSKNAECTPVADIAEAKGPDFGPGFGPGMKGKCHGPKPGMHGAGFPAMHGAFGYGPKAFGQCGPKAFGGFGPAFGPKFACGPQGFGPKGPDFGPMGLCAMPGKPGFPAGGPCGPGVAGRMNDRGPGFGPGFGGPCGPKPGFGPEACGPEACGPDFGPKGPNGCKPAKHGNPMAQGHFGRGRVLTALSLQDGMTQKDLAFLLGIRPQSLGELLGKLEADGYITRERSEADKRASIVKLTDAGREKAEHVKEMRNMNVENMFSKLTDEEKAQLCALLAKLED